VALKGVSQTRDLTPTPQCFVRDEGRRGPALLIFTTVPLCRCVGRESAFGVLSRYTAGRLYVGGGRRITVRTKGAAATSCDLSSLRPLPLQR